MITPASILVFGRDSSLLETRRLVLQSTGGAVYAASTIQEAEEVLNQLHPELVVLCYTLSAQERDFILSAAERLGREIKTLALTADGKSETGEGVQDIFAGARAFKTKVMEVLGQDPPSNQQQCH